MADGDAFILYTTREVPDGVFSGEDLLDDYVDTLDRIRYDARSAPSMVTREDADQMRRQWFARHPDVPFEEPDLAALTFEEWKAERGTRTYMRVVRTRLNPRTTEVWE